MSEQLFTLPQVVVFDTNAALVSGAKANFYIAGTLTRQNTYTDSALTTPHANPVVADGNGLLDPIYLDATLNYKVDVTDPLDSSLEGYPVDNLTAALTATEVGTALWPTTTAETAAGVTVVNFEKKPRSVWRYGTNTTPGSTDLTTACQAAIDVGAQDKAPGYLPAEMGEVLITTALAITSSKSGLVGDGKGLSRILASSVNGFNVSAGLSFPVLKGFSVASAIRYTDIPNVLTGIAINGTTASQTTYVDVDNIFIDGFKTCIKANGVTQSTFEKIETLFCFNGLTSGEKSFNNQILGCDFVTTKDSAALGSGIKLGNGSAASQPEGWWISDTLCFGFARGIWGLGSTYIKVHDCFIDSFGEFGVVLDSSATHATTNWEIIDTFMAASAGATADTGIFLANDITPNANFDNGHRIVGNEILVYSGGTLNYGILSTGTDEKNHTFDGNKLRGATIHDMNLDANCTEATVVNNHAFSNGYQFSVGCDPYFDNNRGTVVGGIIPAVASTAALTLPTGPKTHTITGTDNITSIVTTGHTGETHTLIFGDILTFTDGSNLKLAGDFVTTADDVITIFCDGTNWFEISRSVN